MEDRFCPFTLRSITSENTLREFPLVIATVAKVSRKRRLWPVVRVNKITARHRICAGLRIARTGNMSPRFLFVTLTVSLDLLVVLKNLLRDHNEMKLEVILRIVYIKTGIDAHHI